jgi:type I restriction enzyme M protein
MQPDPLINKEMKICDPACGTGGFLVAAYEYLIEKTKGAIPVDEVKRYQGKDLLWTGPGCPSRRCIDEPFPAWPKPLSTWRYYLRTERGERYDVI